MKPVYLGLVISCFLLNSYGQNINSWDVLNEGHGYDGIDFINENVGWLKEGDILYKTEDAGETWIKINDNSDKWRFQDFDFYNDSLGWAIGNKIYDINEFDHQQILKTTDGGYSWYIQKEFVDSLNGESYSFDIQVLSDTLVYAVDYIHKTVLKTSDGGNTWNDITPTGIGDINFTSFEFVNSNIGVIIGSDNEYPIFGKLMYIIKTHDGGNSWEKINKPDYDNIRQVQFINDSTVYFLSGKEDFPNFTNYLCFTNDLFGTWNELTQRQMQYMRRPIHSFKVINDHSVFTIFADTSSATYIMQSVDNGMTWELKQKIWGGGSIYFAGSKTGFVLGNPLYRSTDFGEKWQMQDISYPFLDVYFVDQNIGYACGGTSTGNRTHAGPSYGDLFKSTDGGKTWKHVIDDNQLHPTGGGLIFSKCFFRDEMTGFIMWGGLHKTNNGGEDWQMVYPDSQFSVNDLVFKNTDVGWAVGGGSWSEEFSGAAIIATNNGGEDWDFVWKYPENNDMYYNLNSVYNVEGITLAVGEQGMIVKHSEQEPWRLRSSGTDLPLRKVFFSDENHGWIAGGYSDANNRYFILLKTNDSGETWQKIAGFDYDISDLYFRDNLHGWAIGSDTNSSGIIYTKDGGYNWTFQVEDLPITAIHFTDGYGWAVGGNGLVLKTDGTTWIDQNTGQVYPSKYGLSQNYPNPFNPITTIEYQLPVKSHVELSVYNILGEKVTNLVAKWQESGYHSVEWQAQGMASGIYYYRLQAGPFSQTKKMIFIK